jgi:hypothetical protein
MARKPNYDFEKRRKELERKRKQEEKLRRKRDNAAAEREENRAPEGGMGPESDQGGGSA